MEVSNYRKVKYKSTHQRSRVYIHEDHILEVINDLFKTDVIKYARTRRREHTELRHLCWYMMYKHSHLSLSQIGRKFNKNHATVLHGLKKMDDFLEYYEPIKTKYAMLCTELQNIYGVLKDVPTTIAEKLRSEMEENEHNKLLIKELEEALDKLDPITKRKIFDNENVVYSTRSLNN